MSDADEEKEDDTIWVIVFTLVGCIALVAFGFAVWTLTKP